MLRRLLLRSFSRVYRLDRRLRRRLTPIGYLVLGGMGAALVLGINTRLNLANQIFALLLVILLLGVISSPFFRPRLRVRRFLPPCATVGEPLRYTLQVENLGHRHQRGLYLVDELQDIWPSYREFLHKRDPADRYRNLFDRFVGYPRWLWLVQQKRGADIVPAPLPLLPAGGKREVTLRLTPRRRGYLRFQGYRIARPDPFGLLNAIQSIRDAGSLLILPKRYSIHRLDLPGMKLYQPGGVGLAKTAGDSEEFVTLRDYRPGDSLRDIHWRSWAKTGKPIVRENRQEYFTRHALILDTFVPEDAEARLEEAVSVAASFLCTLDTRETLLDLLFVDHRVYRFTVGRGLENTFHLLKILACVEGVYGRPFARLRQAVVQYASQLSGCLLILLDWNAERQGLVQELRSRGVKIRVLVITDERITNIEASSEVTPLPIGQIAEKLWAL